ncbi:MAG: hypothetical protein HY901_34985 [Deltaproteobacteria bacterium]|nr:hypothetical protein [Deltaproteobacteria bacterium]
MDVPGGLSGLLGAPRPSGRFGTFIPVGYPTEEQLAQGLTGSAIGVHGTRASLAWLGELTTLVDTTDGCVAVGRGEEMAAIAEAVWSNPRGEILIR